ncbi:MAG: ATP-dependent zinc metalloprotease FtsH [Fidelibacterota bacterium]
MSDNKKNKKPNKDNKKPDKNNDFKWKQASKTSMMWLIIIVSTIILFGILGKSPGEEVKFTYTQYAQQLEQGNIKSILVVDKELHGELVNKITINIGGRELEVKKFVITLPFIDSDMLNEWKAKGIEINFKQDNSEWTAYLLNFLPWLLIIGVWIFIIRRMQGNNNKGVFGFGKSKAKLWTADTPKVTFNNVAGCQEAKEELEEVIEFLKSPEKFSKLGGKIPKGALLLGPPGTGKTLLAKAVAGEAGVPFFSISGAEFVEMFVGVGASRVRDLFQQGKKNAPCIIFIDEIDAVGRHRGAGLGGGHDEREQTLNQLLVEMDGFDENTNIIIIAATNRPDVLDNALLRPGRFDRQIIVDSPDVNGRAGILEVHTKEIPLDNDVNLKVIARGTPGLVGADLANLVNEAALLAARRGKDKVQDIDFEDAKDKVMMGKERKSMVISEEERKLTAYHEAGHVLVALNIPEADPIHKVTIIPRGRAMGVTHQLPLDDRHNYSRSYIKGRLGILLGGRAAEQMVFNDLSTGAGNDIERATGMARKMVCEWGMSEKLGPLTFGKKQEEIFLGREISQHRDFSEETAKVIDQEVRKIVEEAQRQAVEILKERREELELLAQALLEHEILDADEIKKVVNGEKVAMKPEEKLQNNPPDDTKPKEESGKNTENTDDNEKPASEENVDKKDRDKTGDAKTTDDK